MSKLLGYAGTDSGTMELTTLLLLTCCIVHSILLDTMVHTNVPIIGSAMQLHCTAHSTSTRHMPF